MKNKTLNIFTVFFFVLSFVSWNKATFAKEDTPALESPKKSELYTGMYDTFLGKSYTLKDIKKTDDGTYRGSLEVSLDAKELDFADRPFRSARFMSEGKLAAYLSANPKYTIVLLPQATESWEYLTFVSTKATEKNGRLSLDIEIYPSKMNKGFLKSLVKGANTYKGGKAFFALGGSKGGDNYLVMGKDLKFGNDISAAAREQLMKETGVAPSSIINELKLGHYSITALEVVGGESSSESRNGYKKVEMTGGNSFNADPPNSILFVHEKKTGAPIVAEVVLGSNGDRTQKTGDFPIAFLKEKDGTPRIYRNMTEPMSEKALKEKADLGHVFLFVDSASGCISGGHCSQ
ncbi:MAG: hypothetical protein HON43_02895 [Alphaproteobacteria bacterium]|nr:hypothetical protein [Alphaproteobacteria bacterium]MBT5390049.1 hypothetical protein [Alphaproteobacteria bacterium]